MTRIRGQLTTADYLPMDMFRKLLDALEKDGEYLWATYCWLSFCTAFRASDVRTLRWKDVLGRNRLVKTEKKTRKSRMVKFSLYVQEKTRHLYDLRALCLRDDGAFGGSPDPAQPDIPPFQSGDHTTLHRVGAGGHRQGIQFHTYLTTISRMPGNRMVGFRAMLNMTTSKKQHCKNG